MFKIGEMLGEIVMETSTPSLSTSYNKKLTYYNLLYDSQLNVKVLVNHFRFTHIISYY